MSDSNKIEKDVSIKERIAALEREKLAVKEQIEALMAEMAAECGKASLKKRRYDVGYAPNDWSDDENV